MRDFQDKRLVEMVIILKTNVSKNSEVEEIISGPVCFCRIVELIT